MRLSQCGHVQLPITPYQRYPLKLQSHRPVLLLRPQTPHSHIGNLVPRLEAASDFKKMGEIVSAPFQSPMTKSRGATRSDRIGGWGSIILAITRIRGISWKIKHLTDLLVLRFQNQDSVEVHDKGTVRGRGALRRGLRGLFWEKGNDICVRS
jgi:hypothetical protein